MLGLFRILRHPAFPELPFRSRILLAHSPFWRRLKLAMLRVDRALTNQFPEARLLLQVHDELIVECPEEVASQVAALVSSEMESVAKLNVPLIAEAKWGKSWFEAK